ncbi:hypothetical protein Q6257_29720, partial [Klebsiella variicola]
FRGALECNRDLLLLALGENAERRIRADRQRRHAIVERLDALNDSAIQRLDDIAGLQACLGGRTTIGDGRDERATHFLYAQRF